MTTLALITIIALIVALLVKSARIKLIKTIIETKNKFLIKFMIETYLVFYIVSMITFSIVGIDLLQFKRFSLTAIILVAYFLILSFLPLLIFVYLVIYR